MKPRHTEEVATETLLDLTKQIQRLCLDQPTTAEIEEALRLVRPIEVTLRAWMGSRRLTATQAQRAAEFREKHPAVAEVVEGQTEAARVDHAHVHPVFAPLLGGLQRLA